MRPFVFFGLIILLAGSSCRKESIDAEVAGNWKLISYINKGDTGFPPFLSRFDQMILYHDHTYQFRARNVVGSSGTYHVGPGQPVIHFSADDPGYRIEFSAIGLKMTLIYLAPQIGEVRLEYIRN